MARQSFIPWMNILVSYLGTAVAGVARSIFSLGTASAATEPGANVNPGEDALQGDVISVPGFEKNMKKGESQILPLGGDNGIKIATSNAPTNSSNVDVTKVFVEIKDSYGQTLTTWVEGEGTMRNGYEDVDSEIYKEALANIPVIAADGISFAPKHQGVYKVRYFVLSTNDVWVSTGSYDVKVTSESMSMLAMDNSVTNMPKYFNSSKENTIDISLPMIYDEDGEVVTEDILLGGTYGENGSKYHYILNYTDVAGEDGVKLKDVTKMSTEETNVYKEYKTYTVRKVDGEASTTQAKYALMVDVTLTSGSEFNNYDSFVRLESLNATETGSVYDLNPYSVTISANTNEGKNVVQYNLYKVNNGALDELPITYHTVTITGTDSFDEDKIEVVASPSSTLKSRDVSYKEKVYLPKVNAVDAGDSNNAIENYFYYYKVQVEDGDSLISDESKVTLGKDENGFYFIPKAARGSYYDLSYEAIDAFGNSSEDSNKDDSYSIQINDNVTPTAVFTESYDYSTIDMEDPTTIEDFKDISYVIPTKVATGNDQYLRIPALAAADLSDINMAYRRINSSAFLKDGQKVSSAKDMTITDNVNGLPTQNADIGVDILDYLYFVDYEGRDINAEGYFVKNDDHSQYVDEDGNVVPEEEKVFAFKDEEGHNLSGTALRNAVNSCEAFVKLDPAIFGEGTYTLRLNAQDKAGYNNTNRENKFELVAELDEGDKTTPVVEFGAESIAEVGAKSHIKLAIPTATDDVDTRLNVMYFINIDGSLYQIEAKDDYLEFDMDEKVDGFHTIYELASVSGSFKVVAFAFNDYSEPIDFAVATEEELKEAHIGYDYYVVSVKKANDEMPTITDIKPVVETPTQFETFFVPGFTFHDDTNSVKVRAVVTDTNGTVYPCSAVSGTVIHANDVDGGYDYVYGGIKFEPSNADRDNYYTVTYTLMDSADNVVSYSVVLVHAEDKTGPTISGLKQGSSESIEYGEVYRFSKLKAVDNFSNETTITASVTNEFGEDVSPWFNMSTLTFSPEATGTYKIVLTAEDQNGNDSQPVEVTLTVTDSLAPVITLEGATSDNIVVPEPYLDNNEEVVFQEVELPTFSVADQKPYGGDESLFKDTSTGTFTITAPVKDSNSVSTYTFDINGNILNNVANTLNLSRDGNKFTFVPTSRGVYTVTYSASDEAGNEATSKVITVNVGDTVPPKIFYMTDVENTLKKGFVIGENDTFVINKNAIICPSQNFNYNQYKDNASLAVWDKTGFNKDGHDAQTDLDFVALTIKITNSNGTEVTPTTGDDGKLHYTFTTAGTYTISISAEDVISNKDTKTMKFTVSSKESSKSDTSAIVGVVLIVVSAVVLAGVIVYFVRGTKMLPKKNAKKSNKKED